MSKIAKDRNAAAAAITAHQIGRIARLEADNADLRARLEALGAEAPPASADDTAEVPPPAGESLPAGVSRVPRQP